MRNIYVKREGKDVHKKAVIKLLNKGRSLSKSFNRPQRVKGDAKKGSSNANIDSVVKRAFRFPHNSRNTVDSGVNHHMADDYCCVMVQSSSHGLMKVKNLHMLIGKFQRFGNVTCSTPLELMWSKAKGDYRAVILVLEVAEYIDGTNELCLKPTGEIIASLKNVHSSCIAPISPALEDSPSDQNGLLITNASMKLSELEIIFNVLYRGKKHFIARKDIRLAPITVKDREFPFLVIANETRSAENLPVCNLCHPPVVMGKVGLKPNVIQRAIRNHIAAHLIHTNFADEPCGLCCGSTCNLEVDISDANRKNILERGAVVAPGAFVNPNCKIYCDVEPFPFKFCKPVAFSGFPSSNMPVLCRDCTNTTFIWSYNIEKHYDIEHGGLSDDDRLDYANHFPSEKEKDEINHKFPI